MAIMNLARQAGTRPAAFCPIDKVKRVAHSLCRWRWPSPLIHCTGHGHLPPGCTQYESYKSSPWNFDIKVPLTQRQTDLLNIYLRIMFLSHILRPTCFIMCALDGIYTELMRPLLSLRRRPAGLPGAWQTVRHHGLGRAARVPLEKVPVQQ